MSRRVFRTTFFRNTLKTFFGIMEACHDPMNRCRRKLSSPDKFQLGSAIPYFNEMHKDIWR
jgi:hypothetical protein